MMPGLGKKTFTAGDILTANQVNGYLMDQSVMAFADSATRGSAVTAPSDGMVSFLQDTNSLEAYRAFGTAIAAWEPITPGLGNKIINGDFEINQRAFTTTTTNATYGFDRWKTVIAGDGTSTYSAQTFTAGTAPVAGYEARNFARIVTTGQTSAAVISTLTQAIEDVRTFSNSTITVSFWAKSAAGSPKIAVEIDQDFGSGGSPSSAVKTYGGQVTISSSWARYYVSLAVPSISGKTIGTTVNSSVLNLNLWVSAGSTYASRTGTLGIQTGTFDIWGVQVEQGSTVSPFRTATGTKQGELAACQRYYATITTPGVATALYAGFAYATTLAIVVAQFPVPMRIAPVLVLSAIGDFQTAGAAGSPLTLTGLSIASASNLTSRLGLTVASGLTAGQGAFLEMRLTSSVLSFNAEI
jgi:hypothetical protein